MQKKSMRKILSWLLTLTMVLTMLPTAVLADEIEAAAETPPVALEATAPETAEIEVPEEETPAAELPVTEDVIVEVPVEEEILVEGIPIVEEAPVVESAPAAEPAAYESFTSAVDGTVIGADGVLAEAAIPAYAESITTNGDSHGTLAVEGAVVTLTVTGTVPYLNGGGSMANWVGFKITAPEGVDPADVTITRPDGATRNLAAIADVAGGNYSNMYWGFGINTERVVSYLIDWNSDGTIDLTVTLDATAAEFEVPAPEPSWDGETIASVDDLKAFRDAVNAGDTFEGKTVTMTNTVDLSEETDWTPIGNGTRSGSGYTGAAFKGTFNGDGFSIIGLTVTGSPDTAGLFGVVDGGTVKKVSFEKATINVSTKNAGTAVGLLTGGGTVSEVNTCANSAVTAPDGAGGIVGRITVNGTVGNCGNAAAVTAAAAGGIVGKAYYTEADKEMTITGCVNNGIITGTATGGAGGIAGFSAANITNCTNSGAVTATAGGVNVGGIVGWQTMYGEISGNNNYANIETDAAVTTAGGIVGWINYQYATDGTASEYGNCEIVSVTGNTNNGTIAAAGSQLGSGGIVGGIYNAAVVTGNINRAVSVSGSSFAAGVVGNLQVESVNGFLGEGVNVTRNYSETAASAISANCVHLLAYNNDESVFTVDSVMVGNSSYPTLQAAIDAVDVGDTVTVLKDVELTAGLSVASGKELTLDLAGKTVSYSADVLGEAMLVNNGKLTMADSSAEKSGVFTYTYTGAPDTSYGKGNYTIENRDSLVINGGAIENKTAKMSHAYYAITNYAAYLEMNGGSVTCDTHRAIRLFGANEMVMNGGEVTGTIAIYLQAPGSNGAPAIKLTVNGGTLKGTDETYNMAVYSLSNGDSLENVAINVTGGTFLSDIGLTGGSNKTAVESVTISGGTFKGEGVYSYGADELAVPAIAITGGTFATNDSAYYAYDDGYVFEQNADGTYGVAPIVVATIGDVTYPTLKAALEAAVDGDTVTLLDNVTETESVKIDAGSAEITLAGSYTATFEKPIYVSGGMLTVAEGVTVVSPKGLYIGGEDATADDGSKMAFVQVLTGATVTVQNNLWIGSANGAYENGAAEPRFGLYVNGGTVNNTSNAFTVRNTGIVAVQAGGQLTAPDSSIRGVVGVMGEGSKITLTLGNLYGETGVTANLAVQDGGALVVKGNLTLGGSGESRVNRRGLLAIDGGTVTAGSITLSEPNEGEDARGMIGINAAKVTETTVVIDQTNGTSLEGKVEIGGLTDGFTVVYGEDGDVSFVEKPVIAMIGETKYYSLDAAIEAAGTETATVIDIVGDVENAEVVTYEIPSNVSFKVSTDVTIKNAVFDGGNSAETTVSRETCMITVSGATLTADNVTIQNCNATVGGAAIILSSGGKIIAEDCVFQNNITSRSAAAIYTDSITSEMTLTNCKFLNNTSQRYGGALYMQGTATGATKPTMTATGCEFTGNECTGTSSSAAYGAGGAIWLGYSKATMADVTFTDNTAALNGGAITATWTAELTITGDSSFSGNVAAKTAKGGTEGGFGGAINYASTAKVSVVGTAENPIEFTGNEAKASGGAIRSASSKSSLTLKYVTLTENVSASYGGAMQPMGTTVMENCVVTNNTANSLGAVRCYGGTATIKNSVITDNVVKTGQGLGSGLVADSSCALTIENVTITGNGRENTATSTDLHATSGMTVKGENTIGLATIGADAAITVDGTLTGSIGLSGTANGTTILAGEAADVAASADIFTVYTAEGEKLANAYVDANGVVAVIDTATLYVNTAWTSQADITEAGLVFGKNAFNSLKAALNAANANGAGVADYAVTIDLMDSAYAYAAPLTSDADMVTITNPGTYTVINGNGILANYEIEVNPDKADGEFVLNFDRAYVTLTKLTMRENAKLSIYDSRIDYNVFQGGSAYLSVYRSSSMSIVDSIVGFDPSRASEGNKDPFTYEFEGGNRDSFGPRVSIYGDATIDNSKLFVYVGQGDQSGFDILGNANVTITDTYVSAALINVGTAVAEKYLASGTDTAALSATLKLVGSEIENGQYRGDNNTKNGINVGDGTNKGTLIVENSTIDETVRSYGDAREVGLNVSASGLVELNGAVIKAPVATNKGTINVSGESTLALTAVTGNPIYVVADTTLTDTNIAGVALYAGYSKLTDSLTLTINGCFKANGLYVGNKTEHYPNGEVHTLGINDGAEVNVGAMYVRPTCIAVIGTEEGVGASVVTGDLYVRGQLTANNSTLTRTGAVGGGSGHWTIYEDDDYTLTPSVTLNNSTLSTNYLVVGSNSNSVEESASYPTTNAKLTATNSAITLSGSLYVRGNDSYANTVELKSSTITAGEAVYVNDAAEIIIDAADAAVDTKVIDANGTASLEGNVTVENLAHELDVAYGTDGDVTIVEKVFVAEVNGVKYETLAEAVAAVEAGGTVTVIAEAATAGVVINKDITIDFGGYTVAFNEGVGSTGTESNGLQILSGNTVELKNGTLKVADEAAGKFYILVQNYADLTVTDMTLDGTNLDKWSLTDGDSYTLSNNSGVVNITGATNIIANNDGDKAFAFDVYDSASYAVKPVVNVSTTGKITGAIEVSDTISTNLNISGGTYTVEIANEWCTIGYEPVDNGDGTYGVAVVEDAVAYDEAGVLYKTVQDAINAVVVTGGTVKLLSVDGSVITEDMAIVKSGVTLDLNGCSLACSYLVGFNGSDVIDSSADKSGKVLCERKGLMLASDNASLPVWVGDGYMFETVTKLQTMGRVNGESYQYIFLPDFATIEGILGTDGGEAHGVSIRVALSWDETNFADERILTYTDEQIKTVYGSNGAKAFSANIKNYAGYVAKNIQLQVKVVSELGVEIVSEASSITE